jgi:hypothetical protein
MGLQQSIFHYNGTGGMMLQSQRQQMKEGIYVTKMTNFNNSPFMPPNELKEGNGEKCHGNGMEGEGPTHLMEPIQLEPKIFNANELRMHLMPIWQKLYNNEPECIPFRYPIDPKELNIPVKKLNFLNF